ncbi:hypothetical protein HYX14_01835 [Candidatus Woesearchaeota archaeon]|nr:hypothetical protein [Candidatus Woesearchaeota archaeon]
MANLFLIPILAKKEWPWGFILFVPIVGMVFYFIWQWKIYELRKYPGWLALIPLGVFIPFLGMLLGLGHLIVLGFVAWMDK